MQNICLFIRLLTIVWYALKKLICINLYIKHIFQYENNILFCHCFIFTTKILFCLILFTDQLRLKWRIDNRAQNYYQKNKERLRVQRLERQRLNNAFDSNRNRHFQCAILNSTNYHYPLENSLGFLNIKCIFCNAVRFKDENLSMCCHGGKLSHLRHHDQFPAALKHLFIGVDKKSINFREFI